MTAARPPLPDDAPHVLVVDDDSRIRTLLTRFLGDQGFRVTDAASAAEARNRLSGMAFDIIVLDVMMPGESGIELTAALREANDVPILMLTARAETDDRIGGLEAGADDYLTKPFDPRELVLRIRNLLKRRGQPEDRAAITEATFGPFVFNVTREELKEGDTVIRLTERERHLLRTFIESGDGIVSRDDLAAGDAALGDRTIDVQINRLRRKIEPDPANPIYLQTVRGVGYRLRFD